MIQGPPGKYRFLVAFQQGAAAAGGQAEFYVGDPAELPAVKAEVVLWGEDAALAKWLADHHIRTRPVAQRPGHRDDFDRRVILAAAAPPAPGGVTVFADLARRIASGSTAIFLSPAVFAKANQPAGWVPLARKGSPAVLPSWLYHKDEWAKNHPIFDGTSGGRPDGLHVLSGHHSGRGLGRSGRAARGRRRCDQYLDRLLGRAFGFGPFVRGRPVYPNTLLIRENLGQNPAADRLLVNMLRYAACDVNKPPVALPADFGRQLKTLGF